MFVGSDDGVYRVTDGSAERVLEAGRAMRLRRLDGVDGLFAATETGLYWSPDGDEWTALDVPREKTFAVGASADGAHLYAGTRPAGVYVAGVDGAPTAPEWREFESFRDRPVTDEWRLPRHENLAHVRDVKSDPAAPDRVVAGVEVGGVHVSDDGGETWTDRTDGADADVHELAVVGPATYVAATGFGLFRTEDAGRTWGRLDEAVDQRYFRRVRAVDGTVYAAGATGPSTTWEDEDADPALYAVDGDGLVDAGLPVDETVTGMAASAGNLVAATHRGSLFRYDGDDWTRAGAFPVPGEVRGRYTPVAAGDR